MNIGWKRCFVVTLLAALMVLPLTVWAGEAYVGDLDELTEHGKVRVLTTFNKTNFFLSRGQTQGLEYELLKPLEAFAKKQGYELEVQFIPVTRDKLLPGLLAGYGDVAAASLTITPALPAINRPGSISISQPKSPTVCRITVLGRTRTR